MCRLPHPSLPTSNSRVGNTISSGQWTERVHAWAGQWSGACPPRVPLVLSIQAWRLTLLMVS